MGQYYKPINVKTMEWLYSHNYGNGLKLMEHSWVGNDFVGTVMSLMTKGNKWYKAPIVWCGDYYNEEGETPYWVLVKEEDCIRPEKKMNIKEQKKAILVNHTKKEYVKYSELPKDAPKWDNSRNIWIINPLPLLTALGNDRGNGDYRSGNPDYDKVGIWAGDILSIETEIPKNYEKIKVNFKEI